MGSETFEATVADEKRGEAKRLYYGLVRGGMERDSAMVLVDSLYPNSVTMTFVEHTGVFGLWHEPTRAWASEGNSILYGPNCVMQAELRSIHEPLRSQYAIREFDQFGQPILDMEA